MKNLKKILVVGDGGVGKTSLINYYFGNSFEQKYISTYNIDIWQNNSAPPKNAHNGFWVLVRYFTATP